MNDIEIQTFFLANRSFTVKDIDTGKKTIYAQV